MKKIALVALSMAFGAVAFAQETAKPATAVKTTTTEKTAMAEKHTTKPAAKTTVKKVAVAKPVATKTTKKEEVKK